MTITNIRPKEIKDNNFICTINDNEVIIPLYLKYDDIVFDSDIKASASQSIHPTEDSVYYTDLVIDNKPYITTTDLKAIYDYKLKDMELNVAGTFKVIINKVELNPKRTIFNDNNQKIEATYAGFKFYYDFEDGLAKSSNFYLAYFLSNMFNIDTNKLQKHMKLLEQLINACNLDLDNYKQALLTNDQDKLQDLVNEFNQCFKNKEIKGYITSFFNNNKLIIYYNGLNQPNKIKEFNLNISGDFESAIKQANTAMPIINDNIIADKDYQDFLDYEPEDGDDDYESDC